MRAHICLHCARTFASVDYGISSRRRRNEPDRDTQQRTVRSGRVVQRWPRWTGPAGCSHLCAAQELMRINGRLSFPRVPRAPSTVYPTRSRRLGSRRQGSFTPVITTINELKAAMWNLAASVPECRKSADFRRWERAGEEVDHHQTARPCVQKRIHRSQRVIAPSRSIHLLPIHRSKGSRADSGLPPPTWMKYRRRTRGSSPTVQNDARRTLRPRPRQPSTP